MIVCAGTTTCVARETIRFWSPDPQAKSVTPMIAPFGDFVLRDPSTPLPGQPPKFYSSTGPDPGWQIVQWDIPEQRLSPFARTPVSDGERFTAVAPEATVEITRTGRTESVSLSQDGAVLPCLTKEGNPRESDLLFGPKDRTMAGRTAVLIDPAPLARLRKLIVKAHVAIRYGVTAHPKGCEVSQGNSGIALVLNDFAVEPPQTFFYQLGFNQPCGLGSAKHVHECLGGLNGPGFFFKHNPFGVDDRLPLLGQAFIRNGEARSVTFELLPRLRELIASAPAEMDHHPSHWVVSNTTIGQAIWGDFRLATQWDSVEILLVPSPTRADSSRGAPR